MPFSINFTENCSSRYWERGRPRPQRRSRKLFASLIADGDVRVPRNALNGFFGVTTKGILRSSSQTSQRKLTTEMSLKNSSHQAELRAAGWHTRGYLPHFDGRAIPQFLTLHLGDSIPKKVIERWERQLIHLDEDEARIVLQRRIEKYLDQGYGECYLRDCAMANLVQESLLKFDGIRYNLFSWVIMPNHSHSLFTRAEDWELELLMKAHKSYTAHEANKILNRKRAVLDGGVFRSIHSHDRALSEYR